MNAVQAIKCMLPPLSLTFATLTRTIGVVVGDGAVGKASHLPATLCKPDGSYLTLE